MVILTIQTYIYLRFHGNYENVTPKNYFNIFNIMLLSNKDGDSAGINDDEDEDIALTFRSFGL